MIKDSDFGLDKIYREPVVKVLERWRGLVEWNEQNPEYLFTMFWLAGPEQKTKEAVKFFAGQLAVAESATINYEVKPHQFNLVNNLLESIQAIHSAGQPRVLVVAKGFENALSDTTDIYRLSRAGHDWDQALVEGSETLNWGQPFRSMGKHLVVVTTIGFSAGKENYDKAVRSAAGSQFRSGIIELA